MPSQEEAVLAAEQSINKNLLEVVGTGIDFPLRFNDDKGTFITSNAGERIRDSIHLILSTRIGERMFNPEFGSRLPELVFEPNDEILKRLLRFYTEEALRRWEGRIEINNVLLLDNYSTDENAIGIRIEYSIRNSHVKGSYVFPLYTGVEVKRMQTPGTVAG
jgi:phage baseplate assembly protein W